MGVAQIDKSLPQPAGARGRRVGMRTRLLCGLLLVAILGPGAAVAQDAPGVRRGEMAGYLIVPNDKVPAEFNAGYSMYVAAWPLLKTYPGNRFQSGLFGTWMFAQYDGPAPEKLYSDVEGGLGWWRDTRFATPTPKFIMGGVAPNFVEWANGPGAGKGRDWAKPAGKYGIAQLSPWLLWPPDGLNLKQGTNGELFGWGYLPLPLTPPKGSTGDQSWTLFLNTATFKGPVAFFTPNFWAKNTDYAGKLLDVRPSNPNRALQMETQYIPAALSGSYARIATVRFPAGPLVHRITSYKRKALWDAVQAWFDGGAPASGVVDPAESVVHVFPGKGGATWRIYEDKTPKEQRSPVAWGEVGSPVALDPHTFGYRWKSEFPEYFRLEKGKWVPVGAAEVPVETGLQKVDVDQSHKESSKPYVTPEEAGSCWKVPGPAAGPFRALLGDGSVVTYSWYRFADQPALLNAGLTDAEREALQGRVEKLHRAWTKDREYLPAPTLGTLAELDPALVVTPPKGLEAGYVPIATRQEGR